MDLYQDSYVGAGFSLMNPLEENPRGEPERYLLDRNLQTRLGKGLALMEMSDDRHGNLFNRNLDLHVRFKDLFQRKFPAGVVFATPAPEPVPLDDFKPQGPAEAKLDSHDVLGGMLKNRVDNALFVDIGKRMIFEGKTADLMRVLDVN